MFCCRRGQSKLEARRPEKIDTNVRRYSSVRGHQSIRQVAYFTENLPIDQQGFCTKSFQIR
jgi:hypothetical protein